MIIVIGDGNDITTNEVVTWLTYYNINYKRVNFSEFTNLNKLRISNELCSVKIAGISKTTIKKIWHRRGSMRFLPNHIRKDKIVYPYLKKEEESILKSLEDILGEKTEYIGSYYKEIENFKIDHLCKAKRCMLKIPDTLITTNKKELLAFYTKRDQIITKDIRYGINIRQKEYGLFSAGTFVVEKQMIDKLDQTFAPILVQEKIEKKYEIRVFFFQNKLYAMAILSQNDTKTSVDYRNYNTEMPNRCVPVLLPEDIVIKVKNFITMSGLTTGSIDIIVDQEGDYIFLEVNPQGQLDWLSKNCNYYIEKDIATYLTE